MASCILLLTLLFPPLGIISYYGLAHNVDKWKIYVFCIAMFMSAFAYCYIPTGDPDIVRYFDYIESLANHSFVESIQFYNFRGQPNLFMFTIFCWIAAKIGDPHIIPALSTFSIYYIGLYVTCRVAEDLDVKKQNILLYLLFIVLAINFYDVINNVRNVLSFSLIGFATFRDCYEKKRTIWTYILYIFPLFIHESAFLFLLIRLFIRFIGKMKIFVIAVLVLVVPLLEKLIEFVMGYSSSNAVFTLFKGFIVKAYFYFNDTSSSWGLLVRNTAIFKIERFLDILLAVLICVISLYFSYKKNLRIKDHESDPDYSRRVYLLLDYVFVLSVMTIACAPMLAPEYWRFAALTFLFSGIAVMSSLSVKGNSLIKLAGYSVLCIAPLCTVIWMRFLIMSEWDSIIIKPFVSSPIIVVVMDFLKMLSVG